MATLASSDGQASPRQWPGRNLPEAFFSKPPSSTKSKTSSNTPLSHSRDGSTDSSGRYTLSPPATASLSPLVQHSRTHSSPAIISGNVGQHQAGGNFSSNSLHQPHQNASSALIQHQKHRSFDNTLESDPSMQQLWQQAQGHYHQQQPAALCGEKTSKSLGDLATSGMGLDAGGPFPMGVAMMSGGGGGGMEVTYGDQHQHHHQARKVSCNDPPMMWNEFAAGKSLFWRRPPDGVIVDTVPGACSGY